MICPDDDCYDCILTALLDQATQLDTVPTNLMLEFQCMNDISAAILLCDEVPLSQMRILKVKAELRKWDVNDEFGNPRRQAMSVYPMDQRRKYGRVMTPEESC